MLSADIAISVDGYLCLDRLMWIKCTLSLVLANLLSGSAVAYGLEDSFVQSTADTVRTDSASVQTGQTSDLSVTAAAEDVKDSSNEKESKAALERNAWGKQVDETLRTRFAFWADAAFKYGPPLDATLHYSVTGGGRIVNVRFGKLSSNSLFNVLAMQTLRSIDGDAGNLKPPQCRDCDVIEKYVTFSKAERHSTRIGPCDRAELIWIHDLREAGRQSQSGIRAR
jgi:hypothetical protein